MTPLLEVHVEVAAQLPGLGVAAPDAAPGRGRAGRPPVRGRMHLIGEDATAHAKHRGRIIDGFSVTTSPPGVKRTSFLPRFRDGWGHGRRVSEQVLDNRGCGGLRLFLDFFLYGVVVPLTPLSPAGVNREDQLGFLYGAYAVSVLLVTPLFGYVGDRVGGRIMMLCGLRWPWRPPSASGWPRASPCCSRRDSARAPPRPPPGCPVSPSSPSTTPTTGQR